MSFCHGQAASPACAISFNHHSTRRWYHFHITDKEVQALGGEGTCQDPTDREQLSQVASADLPASEACDPPITRSKLPGILLLLPPSEPNEPCFPCRQNHNQAPSPHG